MPNFNGRGSPSFAQGPKGLADMLASALRGGVKATLGMPGDIERMGRMGINALGGSVDPQASLPTTEDWDKRLPAVNPMTGQNFNQVEKLGEFLPINVLGPAMGAASKAKTAVQALRQAPEAATSMGRRQALKGIGAAGATAVVAPELVVQALRNIPPTPAAAPMVPVATQTVAKGLSAVSRVALEGLAHSLYVSHGSKHAPVADVDRLLAESKKLYPTHSEDELARGLQNLGRTYRTDSSVYGKLSEDDLYSKFGVETEDEMHQVVLDAIFNGKLNPEDLSEEALRGLSRANNDLAYLTNSMSGQ